MTTFDIHTHSVSSGHGTKDTVSDMLREASRRGLHTLGISEHGPAILNAPKPSYFRSLSFAPRKRFGIRVLYGAEVNILDGGKLDLEDDILSGLDYVIASMHHPSHRYGDRVSNTDDYIKAMSDDNVRILGHCDNTQFPVDYDAIVSSAKQYSVIVEINESSLKKDGYHRAPGIDTRLNYVALLSLCKKATLPVLMSSDSHGQGRIGDVEEAEKLIKEISYPEDLIVNLHPELLHVKSH